MGQHFGESFSRCARAGTRGATAWQVADRIGVEPAYLSKVERGDVGPSGKETICWLADDLGEDRDVLRALCSSRCRSSARCASRMTVGTTPYRPAVAAPMGRRITVEEQLTGEAEWGGIQLLAYPM
jgi:transcriptional regulator with XRE-family HTH domain